MKEEPEFVKNGLTEMRQILGKMTKSRRKSFDRALFLRPSLQQDDSFFLMFLRADRFDPMSAANRLCLHFDHKLDLFGESKLAKKITLDDLSEEDMRAMEACFFLDNPERDQSGRIVLNIDIKTLRAAAHWQNVARIHWYLYMALAEDEETQKRGVVHVGNLMGLALDLEVFINLLLKAGPIATNLPLRIVGYHSIYDDARMKPFMALCQTVAGKSMRVRHRTHFGSELETTYAIRSFGIRAQNNAVLLGNHRFEKFIEKRRQIEAELRHQEEQEIQATGIIPYPMPEDVLLGRGRSYWSFHGNKVLNEILDSYTDRYSEGSERLDKTIIAMEVAAKTRDLGGRFLRKIEIGWKLAENAAVREKISQALRTKLRSTSTSGHGDDKDARSDTSPTPVPSRTSAEMMMMIEKSYEEGHSAKRARRLGHDDADSEDGGAGGPGIIFFEQQQGVVLNGVFFPADNIR